jgi:hypothetical protein
MIAIVATFGLQRGIAGDPVAKKVSGSQVETTKIQEETTESEASNIAMILSTESRENTIAIVAARKEWRSLDSGTGAAAARERIGSEARSTIRATENAAETIHQVMTRRVEIPKGAGIGNEKNTTKEEKLAIAEKCQTVEEVQIEAVPATVASVHVIEVDTMNEKSITVTVTIGSTEGDPTTRRGSRMADKTISYGS